MALKEVLELVYAVQQELPRWTSGTYTIAGGCLRDAFFGKPIKDIDLVVPNMHQFDFADWPNIVDYGPTGKFLAANSDVNVNGYPVQFIFRDGDISASAMVEYHSLAVSNFFFSNGLLTIDPQALKDYQDKQHTLNTRRWGGVGDKVDRERLDTYVKKIQNKYPWPIRKETT